MAGIEVELERVLIKEVIPYWKIVKDGSLKLQGQEFTCPVWNTHVHEALTILFNNIIGEPSKRCSVHVHINILDHTLEQIKTLILLYTIFERILFHFSGKRWESNYCVPVQSCFIHLNELNLHTLENIFPKYCAMHLLPERKLGTVEFRHMAGNTNIDYIDTWVQILVTLVNYSKKITLEELIIKLKNMRSESSYWQFSKEVFGQYYYSLQYSDYQKDIEKGILFAKLQVI